MKELIEGKMAYYRGLYPNPSRVLEHLFCTLGNGLKLNHKLKFNENHSSKEVYDFPEPIAYGFIYPWSKDEEFQPFRKYIGCKDVGFKESVDYFLACLSITPAEIAGEWLNNIDLIREVLSQEVVLPTYSKDDVEGFIKSLGEYSTTLSHPQDGTVLNPNSSVKKVWFLDAQWSDLPREVENEVKQLWRDYGLGNDHSICKREMDDELFEDYPKIYLWCKYKGIPEGEKILIHWWW